MKRPILLLMISALLTGCMFPTNITVDISGLVKMAKYHRYNGTSGYTEIAIGENKYQVEYVESGKHGNLEIKRKCIIRAAQIGKRDGFSYFSILDENNKFLTSEKVIEGKSVIKENIDEEGISKTVTTKTPSHVQKTYKTVSQITIQFKRQNATDTLKVNEVLTSAKTDRYL